MNHHTEKWAKVFRVTVMATLTALVIQFVLGMAINLYVQFPGTLPHGNAMGWAGQHSLMTMVHLIVGTLILVLAILSFIFAVSMKSEGAILMSSVGLLFTIVAWGSGEMFLMLGQHNNMSMYMSVGFIVSTLVYSMALPAARKIRTT